jgi:hypothetical protein
MVPHSREEDMASKSDIEAYLVRACVEFEEVEDGTWVITGQGPLSVVVRVDEPIVAYSMNVMRLPEHGTEGLMRTLLELNAEDMLHASFGLEGDIVVLGGAQQLENLDYNEFQAMLDDLYMAATNHLPSLKGLTATVTE